MSKDSTRISSLPNSSTTSADTPTGMNGYMPINNHPNPFGNAVGQMGIMPPPTNVNKPSSDQPRDQLRDQFFEQHQRLPSRDIPQDTTDYTQDNAIKANYIPAPNITYSIKEDDFNAYEYEQKRQKERTFDALFAKIQEPIMITILYFIFQMSAMNSVMYTYMSALGIYKEDGNLNITGMIFKSVIFGSIILFLRIVIDTVSLRIG